MSGVTCCRVTRQQVELVPVRRGVVRCPGCGDELTERTLQPVDPPLVTVEEP